MCSCAIGQEQTCRIEDIFFMDIRELYVYNLIAANLAAANLAVATLV